MFDNFVTQFHFLRPFWLLAGIPLLWALIAAPAINSPLQHWRESIAPHLLKALSVQKKGRTRWFNPTNLSRVIICLGILAMAGPSWQRQPSPFVEDQAALVIALDLSASMNQTDIQPSRATRAKQKISDLLALRAGARTALIVFAGSAHTVVPLTNDPAVIAGFLEALVSEIMPLQGKRPETVLPLLDRLLPKTGTNTTLLLISDGISEASTRALTDYFSTRQRRLLILAMGKDASDAQPRPPLSLATLENLADKTEANLQRVTADSSDVRALNRHITQHWVESADHTRPWLDAGYYLLFPLALFFLMWFRSGWTLQWQWLAGLTLLGTLSGPPTSWADAAVAYQTTSTAANKEATTASIGDQLVQVWMKVWLTPNQQGRWYFERGDYAKAAQSFDDNLWKGIAFYYHQDFDQAARLFSQSQTEVGLFNLANTQAQMRHYAQAVASYDRLLARNPEHASARRNKEFILSILHEIEAQSSNQVQKQLGGARMVDIDVKPANNSDTRTQIDRDKYSAEQILADQRIQDMWLRQVQRDPAEFLYTKFHLQLTSQTPHE